MIDPKNIPHIIPTELLARYIVQRRYIRNDGTIRPDAFSPHPYSDLSVTRYLNATEKEIRDIGLNIASLLGKTLYGRGNLLVETCLQEKLTVHAAPNTDNPNHAHISGWPTSKPDQKMIAQLLAAKATFISDL